MTTDDNDDQALWHAALKGTAPLKGRDAAVPARPAVQKRPTRLKTPVSDRPPAPQKGPKARDMDARTAKRLKQGKIEIEARLDLHGYRLEAAQKAFRDFIVTSSGKGQRCVLVITGKGLHAKEDRPNPTIRSELARWIETPPLDHLILRAVPAQQKDGGGGAFYVYIRRPER